MTQRQSYAQEMLKIGSFNTPLFALTHQLPLGLLSHSWPWAGHIFQMSGWLGGEGISLPFGSRLQILKESKG